MRRPFLFAALSLALIGVAAALIYFVGFPLLHGALISCAPPGSRGHAFGCGTPFGAFAMLVLFCLALALAHLHRPVTSTVRRMRYHGGTEVQLGDTVSVPVPEGQALARVVMLGATYVHLDIDARFVEWVNEEKLLNPDAVVVEWLGDNPFAHDDPNYAPVGNYMFSPLDEWVIPVRP